MLHSDTGPLGEGLCGGEESELRPHGYCCSTRDILLFFARRSQHGSLTCRLGLQADTSFWPVPPGASHGMVSVRSSAVRATTTRGRLPDYGDVAPVARQDGLMLTFSQAYKRSERFKAPRDPLCRSVVQGRAKRMSPCLGRSLLSPTVSVPGHCSLRAPHLDV